MAPQNVCDGDHIIALISLAKVGAPKKLRCEGSDMGEERFREVYAPLALYIVGLNVLLVISVAVLHELGHAAVGYVHGCRGIEIVLFNTDIQTTYAQMVCNGSDPGRVRMFLGSFLFVLPLAGIFLALRRLKERFIGHIVLGVGIMVSAIDLDLFIDSVGVGLLVAGIGAVIALYGEDRLVHGIISTEITPRMVNGQPKHN